MNNPIKVIYNGKAYYGFKVCPLWLKKKFKEAFNYTCKDCGLKEDDKNILEIHRNKRGIDGGLYMCVNINHPLNNIKVLCSKCHETYNYSSKLGSY